MEDNTINITSAKSLNFTFTRKKLLKVTAFKTAEDLKRLTFIINELNQHLQLDSSKKVLEIGCGNGNISMGIASMGYQTTGLDIDEESIATATSNNRFPNLTFRTEPAEKLSEADHFDAIVCSEVLEHLDDPGVVLNFALSNLREDGIFISTVPNGYGPREVLMTKPMQFLQKRNLGTSLQKLKRAFGFGHGTVQSNNPNLEHVQFFSKRAILQLHQGNGFILKRFAKGESFANIFPYSILTRRLRVLQKLDCAIADILPSIFASGFYMSFSKKL